MRPTPLIGFIIAAAALTVGACGGDDSAPRDVPPARAVQVSGCSPITYGGKGRPDLLIGTATVLAGQFVDHGIQTSEALKMTLGERDWRAGDYTVGLQICGETTPAGDAASPKLCRRTARAFARNRSIAVVYGPLGQVLVCQTAPDRKSSE